MRYAVSEPAVVVPARVALLLDRLLKLSERRIEWRGQDAQVDEVLLAWNAIVVDYKAQVTRPAASQSLVSAASRGALSSQVDAPCVLSVREVARAAECSAAAITLAARENRLPGVKRGDGTWWFEQDDVASWLVTRQGRRAR